jgi:hypothetical protein
VVQVPHARRARREPYHHLHLQGKPSAISPPYRVLLWGLRWEELNTPAELGSLALWADVACTCAQDEHLVNDSLIEAMYYGIDLPYPCTIEPPPPSISG